MPKKNRGTRPLARAPLPLRFENSYIPEPNSGCWLWIASARNESGYGSFSVNGRNELAHRVSWMIHKGPIPDGLQALHRCDNRWCVNPEHLFLGTNADNVADKESKGRGGQPVGSRHWSAKLRDADVVKIRADKRSAYVIGPEFGLNPATVNRIRSRQTWRHVP
jgi:hypothetical protein